MILTIPFLLKYPKCYFCAAPKVVGLHIEGHGFLADLYRSVVKAFTPLGVKMEVDTVPCLPDPIPPDFERYFQIGTKKQPKTPLITTYILRLPSSALLDFGSPRALRLTLQKHSDELLQSPQGSRTSHLVIQSHLKKPTKLSQVCKTTVTSQGHG